ncbi:hypothetical protein F5Y04DRAFT_60771 [Hypomontagnella monticulosa]|nr:hypothetical protein F5Y04DRAFT_60771 [Hypomontagnella monticulosa]
MKASLALLELSATRGLVTLGSESKYSYAELDWRIGCLRRCRHGKLTGSNGDKWVGWRERAGMLGHLEWGELEGIGIGILRPCFSSPSFKPSTLLPFYATPLQMLRSHYGHVEYDLIDCF